MFGKDNQSHDKNFLISKPAFVDQQMPVLFCINQWPNEN